MKVWHDRINVRPAVQRGLALKAPAKVEVDLANDLEAQKVLFGQR